MSNWTERIKNAINALAGRPAADLNSEELLEWLGIDPASKWKNLQEVTYYTCLKLLSETMGKLPIKYYQDVDQGRIRAEPTEVTRLLTRRPNHLMTPSTLWSTTEMNCQNYGNAYVWMRGEFNRSGKFTNEYNVLSFWPMQSSYVTVIMDDAGIFGDVGKLWYQYNDPRTGKEYLFGQEEILHFKTWFSFDGIMGEPVKNILKYSIEGSKEAQTYMNNLYKNGLTAAMAMQYTGDFKEETVKQLQKKFADKLTGSQNAGKVIPIPVGLALTPLKMNPTDAQFFELRKYNATQIAAAFGIKPNQINDYEKSSYSNSETQQLAFWVDTMSYRIKMYEEEINAKVLTPKQQKEEFLYKFNEKAILRADSKTQMSNLASAVNNGIYTPNEARAYMDMPAQEGGDVLMVNGNYIPIAQVGQQYAKGGE